MTSTSSESVVLRGELAGTPTAPMMAANELRAGTWTRLGASTVLGDSATEATLGGLADRARAAGMAQGYAAGWAEGRRRAQEEADRAATARSAADHEATQALRAGQQALVDSANGVLERCDAELALRAEHVGVEATELALRIAEAVLGHELAAMTDAGAEAIARAVAEVPASAVATVRLHPDGQGRPRPHDLRRPPPHRRRRPRGPPRWCPARHRDLLGRRHHRGGPRPRPCRPHRAQGCMSDGRHDRRHRALPRPRGGSSRCAWPARRAARPAPARPGCGCRGR